MASKTKMSVPKRGKAPKPAITVGGTTVSLGRTAPARRGNRGGKG